MDSTAPIPTYRIDLSLAPSVRYTQLATDFAPQMRSLTPIFDEVLATVITWRKFRTFIEFLASIVLRRVFSSEETEELRGISKASGVQMYFLVALNVLLDSLLGCTSGGALVVPKERKRGSKSSRGSGKIPAGTVERMMHFRTLDWSMDGLRRVLVVLEFVRSESNEPEMVRARSITYAGFVGCLTGVREDLSLSLNFRPNHHCATRSLRWHQLLVLFGLRQSIISVLRHTLLSEPTPLAKTITALSITKSAPCYLVISDSASTTVIEKDLSTVKIRSSDSFIVHTNHDVHHTATPHAPHESYPQQVEKTTILGLEAFLEESEDRRQCIAKKWTALTKRHAMKSQEGPVAVRESTLVKWVQKFPVMNESTHFGCLMDPKTGTVRWIERGVEEESSAEEGRNGEGEEEHFDPELAETDPKFVENGEKFRRPEGMVLSNVHLDMLGGEADERHDIEKMDRMAQWIKQARANRTKASKA